MAMVIPSPFPTSTSLMRTSRCAILDPSVYHQEPISPTRAWFIQVNSTFVSLAEGRAFAGGAYAAGKVVIAGGAVAFFPESFGLGLNFTNSVEIFDVATGQHTTSTLPGPARGTFLPTFISASSDDAERRRMMHRIPHWRRCGRVRGLCRWYHHRPL